jgi:hypothetical protein
MPRPSFVSAGLAALLFAAPLAAQDTGPNVGGALGQKYGVFNAKAGLDSRVLFIVGPDGKITYRAKPFHELVESEYTDLGSAVRKTAGE